MEEMWTNWTGAIWTLQWSLMLERFTEVRHPKCQEGWKRLKICKIFQKTSTSKSTVLRTPYSELISVNFLLKLYFEKSHWRKRQKHRGGLRTFYKLCPYICTTVRDHVDLHCSVRQTSRWHANSGYYPEVFPQSVLAYDVFTNAENCSTTHTSHNG
jgi:hypothetical protein